MIKQKTNVAFLGRKRTIIHILFVKKSVLKIVARSSFVPVPSTRPLLVLFLLPLVSILRSRKRGGRIAAVGRWRARAFSAKNCMDTRGGRGGGRVEAGRAVCVVVT